MPRDPPGLQAPMGRTRMRDFLRIHGVRSDRDGSIGMHWVAPGSRG